jgi:hypothetical protein
MPIVAQGGTVTLEAVVGHSNGSPADDANLTLTILDDAGVPVAGFPVAIPPIVRDDLGEYHYDWTVPALLPVGDYTATWDATVDGADAGGSEQVEVVPPGSVGTTGLTTDQFRAFQTTTLADAELALLLAAAWDEIEDAAGPQGTVTERLGPFRGDRLMLSREADSITSVVEDARSSALTLAADDYELSDSGKMLYRLTVGTHPRWAWWGRIHVTYTVADDTAQRQRVQRDLVMLDLIGAGGVTSERIGDWTQTFATSSNPAEMRASILASLGSGVGIL